MRRGCGANSCQLRAEAENGSSGWKTHTAAAGGREVSTYLDTRRRDAGSSPIADAPSQTGADTYSGQERIAASHAESRDAEEAETAEHGGPGSARVASAGPWTDRRRKDLLNLLTMLDAQLESLN